jgi:cell division protein FtsZ
MSIFCSHCGSRNHQSFDCSTPERTYVPPVPEPPAKPAAAAPAVAEPPVADDFPIQPGTKKTRGKGSKLSFGATGRGKFQNVEPTIYNGQDLEIPTFVRRGIQLDR